jgi:DNA polymerase/3'-5' exonuclease PolX
MHQVGFSLNKYMEMHGQQNIKFRNYFLAVRNLVTTEFTVSQIN